MADKIGEIFVEIGTDLSKLDRGMDQSINKGVEGAKKIEKAFNDIKPGANIPAMSNAIKGLETNIQRVPNAMNQMTKGTNNMNMALGQLGFLIGDADMFFVNFRMGMMSIANNVPMVVQGLAQAKTAAEATGQSFSKALASSLIGPGGVMIGVNLLMFALNTLPSLFAKSDKAVSDHAQKVKELADQYKDLSTAEIEHAKNQVYSDLISGVSDTKAKGKVLFNKNGFAFMGEDNEEVNKLVEDANAKIQALNNALNSTGLKLADIFMGNVPKSIQATSEAIRTLRKEWENTTDDKTRAKLDSMVESLEAVQKKLKGEHNGKAQKDALKDREEDLKSYYEQVKWFDADYNKFLDEQLAAQLKDLGNTVKDKGKLHEFEIQERKKRESDYQKWLEDNRPELIFRNGKINADARGAYDSNNFNTMFPKDGFQGLREASESGFKNLMNEFQDGQNAAERFANTISSGFANAVMGGQTLLQTLGNIGIELGVMAVKALAFQGIMALINSFGGGGALMAMSALGSVNVPTGSGSTSAPMQQSLSQINGSIQAMNVNMMSRSNAPVQVFLDGREITKNVLGNQKKLNKGGVNVD